MTNLYLKQLSENEFIAQRAQTSPGEGWYWIEREPDIMSGEYLEIVGDAIVIKKRVKTPDQLAAEEKAKKEAELFTPTVVADLLRRVEALEQKG